VFPGSASERMLGILNKEYIKKYIKHASTMKEAANIAFFWAKKGDEVLLSPGAASFNMFLNEFDRGNQFNKAVKKLIKAK
jgi:UDP-N-acetylmuramoylalanine--D-glutamate ligase